jgi:wobble nucleotide-excising tRNase
MDQAVALERKRSKEMEEQEKDLDADQLRKILKQERQRMAGMARTIADLKSTAVQCQSEAEIHEEGRINCLLGRLETMQIEKGRIVNELEREEEMLTNTLQKKLDQVRREKQELEKLIEHEQTSHANLQSKLTGFPSDNACAQATDVGPMLTALDEGEDEDDEDTDLDAVLPDLAAMYGTL